MTGAPHLMTTPLPVGTIHFIGIGGIGMSGIAEILHNLGWRVQGSDQSENYNVKRLKGLGIPVFIGHQAAHIGEAAVVVYSSAVKDDNPERVEARARRLPMVRRAEMLAELMRLKWSLAVAGTHGKTTTTSLCAALFDKAGRDPTVINGGIINAWGTNARLGQGDWMVVEADESDGSFMKLPATVGIITNIDPEHMDHYGDFAKVRDAYATFITNLPFYGFGVLCADHPEVVALLPRVADRRVITYGLSPQADVRAVEVRAGQEGSVFDVVFGERLAGKEWTMRGVSLPMVGLHNVENACAALAVGAQLGFAESVMRDAFAGFKGVKRRFTRTGVVGNVTIIDDYGHHPVEITAVLRAARLAMGGHGRLIAVVQPHRYTRLHDLFDPFCACLMEADAVIIAEVYAAGETPIEGASREALVESLKARGHRMVLPLAGPDALAPLVSEMMESGDYVVCLGAGSISAWANALPAEIAALRGRALPNEAKRGDAKA